MIPLSILPLVSDTTCKDLQVWLARALSHGSGGKLHTEWKGGRRNSEEDIDLIGDIFSVS